MRTVPGNRRNRTILAGAVTLMALLVVAGCAPQAKQSGTASSATAPAKKRQLVLAAYSVPGEAYKKIIPAFQKYWKDKTGEDVTFNESYGASGAQARAVIDGLEADVVHLAMEPDVSKIQKAGLIEPGWQQRTKGNGIPSTSLIVFGVRTGNPKGIADWADVSRKGIGVITPNPKTSGGAQWNLLASWGSVTRNGGTEAAAYTQVRDLYANTLVLDKSARDASNTFLKKGIGDVAILWESDALIAKDAGGTFDIVIPKSTILAETAATVVDANAKKHGVSDLAQAFVEYLFTPDAQKAFAETGLRPVDPAVLAAYASKYPEPATKRFTIADLGGWKQVSPRFFGDAGVYSKVEAEVAKGK